MADRGIAQGHAHELAPVVSLPRTYLINVKGTEKNTSSGAKANFFLALDVGAKAPTPKPPFMR
jgi:hypothetical protein